MSDRVKIKNIVNWLPKLVLIMVISTYGVALEGGEQTDSSVDTALSMLAGDFAAKPFSEPTIVASLESAHKSARRCDSPQATASQSYDYEYAAINVTDTDMLSRWSAKGAYGNKWLQVDCGALVNVIGVRIGFYKSGERHAYFALAGSSNGRDWYSLGATMQSSGVGDQTEYFAFDTTESIRFLRYTGRGNSVNDENSLTDITLVHEGDSISNAIAGSVMPLRKG